MTPPANTYFAAVGPALRILRARAKLSGTAVARSAAMGKSQLSKYETGRELPRMETLAKILDATGVEPLWFFYLVHQLSREDFTESLRSDLFRLRSGAGSPLAPSEEEGFRRHLETLFDLHSAVLKARIGDERSQ